MSEFKFLYTFKILSKKEYAEFCEFLSNTPFSSSTTDAEKLDKFENMKLQEIRKKNNERAKRYRIYKSLQKQHNQEIYNEKQDLEHSAIGIDSLSDSSSKKLSKRKYTEFREFLSNVPFPSTTSDAEKFSEFEKMKLNEKRRKNNVRAKRYRLNKSLQRKNNQNNTNEKKEKELDINMDTLSQQTRTQNIEKCRRYRLKKKLKKIAILQQDDNSLEGSTKNIERKKLIAGPADIYRLRSEEQIENERESESASLITSEPINEKNISDSDLEDYKFRTRLLPNEFEYTNSVCSLFKQDLIHVLKKSTTDTHSTKRSTKRMKLELENETNNEEAHLCDIPDISRKLSPTHLPSETTGNTDISVWCKSLVSMLEELDECTRSFLMNQIDNYVMNVKLQHMKCENQGETIYIAPSLSLFAEVPSTSQCCEFVVKEEMLDIPEYV